MSLLLTEGVAPDTPATGKVHIYAKTDGKLYFKDDTGTEYVATAPVVSAFFETLQDDEDAAEFFTTLGISTFVQTMLDDADAAAVLATLGVSTFVQTLLNDADAVAARTTLGLTIGADVQAYDADTAKLDVDQAWTGAQRGTPTTDNDLSFDMNDANNFVCTPTGGGTLTFTNITSGQSGNIYLVNGSNYTIAKASHVKCSDTTLDTISATGEYWLSYYSPDGTNVLVAFAGDLS